MEKLDILIATSGMLLFSSPFTVKSLAVLKCCVFPTQGCGYLPWLCTRSDGWESSAGWLIKMSRGSRTACPMHVLVEGHMSGVTGRAVVHRVSREEASPLLSLTQVRAEGRMLGQWCLWVHETLAQCYRGWVW